VAMDSLKFHPGPPCPTLLRPAGGPPARWLVYGRVIPPLDTPSHTPVGGGAGDDAAATLTGDRFRSERREGKRRRKSNHEEEEHDDESRGF
jgi:hypothetical protein